MNTNNQKKIYLVCGDINKRFEKYLVETPKVEMDDAIASIDRDEKEFNKRMFVSILQTLNQYTDEQLWNHFVAKNKEWEDWCEDVPLFFAFRHIIFNKEVPIAEPKTKINDVV